MAEESSILKTIRPCVGIPNDYSVFDTELIADINSVFAVLHQLGVGASPFKITGEDETWDSYMAPSDNLEEIKTYMRDRVKLMFDPPMNSFLVDVIQKRIAEFEWRINSEVDFK